MQGSTALAGHELRDFARSAPPAGNGGERSRPRPEWWRSGYHSTGDRQRWGSSMPGRRCGVCEPAATTWFDTLEHRGGATGQRGAPSYPDSSGCDGPVVGWAQAIPDIYQLLRAVLWIDVSLLAFNMLPIYPLDGGQILRSLLWFVLGRARSLMVATPVYASPCTSRCTTQNSVPSGSLLLSRRTLAFPALCRFDPTHILGDFA
jgi:hypothetical protein